MSVGIPPGARNSCERKTMKKEERRKHEKWPPYIDRSPTEKRKRGHPKGNSPKREELTVTPSLIAPATRNDRGDFDGCVTHTHTHTRMTRVR